MPTLSDYGIWAQVVVTAVAAGLVVQQLRAQRRQEKVGVSLMYVKRYWEIDDELLRTEKGTEDHTRAVHRYLRLCQDEFEAQENSLLEAGLWTIWHEWFATGHMRQRLTKDLEEIDPDGSGFALVRACLAGPQDHPTPGCPARRP